MTLRSERHSYLRSLLLSKLFLLFVGIIIVFILFTIIKGFTKRMKVNEDVERLKQDIAQLEGANRDLESLLGYLQSEDFAKQEAKQKFGMKEPGEQVVVLNDASTATRELPPTEAAAIELTNPQKWLRYFFGTH